MIVVSITVSEFLIQVLADKYHSVTVYDTAAEDGW